MVRNLKYHKQKCFEADDGLAALTMVQESLIVRDVSEGAEAVPHFDAVCMDNNMCVPSSFARLGKGRASHSPLFVPPDHAFAGRP